MLEAFAARMQKRRGAHLHSHRRGRWITAGVARVPARLGAGETYDDLMNTVETHCGAYVLGTE